ncbi:cyclase family protein [Actinophytocola sp.]|uniref:cyclase family protein n=1 Tax=Actinophytocola sp. TaxID=1872138 RepID=UPI003D6A1E97
MTSTVAGQAVDEASLRALFAQVSNWGRWGSEDQRGTLNLIGGKEALAGLAAAEAGVAISCGREVRTAAPSPAVEAATWSAVLAGDVCPTSGYGQTRDRITVAPHGPLQTHMDALCHVLLDGVMYNGKLANAVKSTGATVNDIGILAGGVVTRGVLLDIPRVLGVDHLTLDRPVLNKDLLAAERRAGVEVRPGDAVLVRVGRDARRSAEGPECERIDGRTALPGMAAECLRWLRERDVGLLVSDAGHDLIPSDAGFAAPIHIGALVFLGLPLIDNAALDDLADACAELRRWTFTWTVSPLRIQGGTGSLVNPIAVL